jgi:hypothetical protein
MTKLADVSKWLDGVTATKPFTPADAKELSMLIHAMKPGGLIVDVYTTRGDVVHVRVEEVGNATIERELPVV